MIKDNKDLNDRRKLSYLLCEWDDKNLPHTIRYDNLTQQVINFFKTESKLVYPAKAYFLAREATAGSGRKHFREK